LEHEEYVSSVWIPQEGKPARKEYKLTEKGQRVLEVKISDWNKFTSSVNSILSSQPKEALS
jgi:DNA-binding PadR family transcriptional regulator